MNHLLYNISIILIILGIILFTYTLAQAQKKCNCKLQKNNIFISKKIKKDVPSKVLIKCLKIPQHGWDIVILNQVILI